MILGTNPFTLASLNRVVFANEYLELSPEVIERIEASAESVRKVVESGEVVYGITTGFGANRDTVIASKDAEQLQKNLIMSHACGVGKPLDAKITRAMMVLRVLALSKGFSGIRMSTLQYLIDFINKDISPYVPRYGSVGASGDLCPLAHMSLPILGLGYAFYQGEKISGKEALELIGRAPADLTYKEGLALLNGTQAMTAIGVYAAYRVKNLLDAADICGALSLEALAGRLDAFDKRVHYLRGRKGQEVVAENILAMLKDSSLAGCKPGEVEGKKEFIQDSYCFRCMPQVHGASRDVLDYFTDLVVEVEANAVTDNPIVFREGDQNYFPVGYSTEAKVISGGNFHGQPIALALDYLKLAVSEIGSISERRIALLTDKQHSDGLPAFLVDRPGLNSGLMVAQYVAAALASDNKAHVHPSSADSIPTSANTEDHVSMGMNAGIRLLSVIDNVEYILGIELLTAAQGIDLRAPVKGSPSTQRLLDMIRKDIPFIDEDRVLNVDIDRATEYIRSGKIAQFAHSSQSKDAL